jgi:hypothetical protein
MKHLVTAERIVHVYLTDPEIKQRVDDSPEPYRALIWETGIVPNPQEIDGSEEYDLLVDELEKIW